MHRRTFLTIASGVIFVPKYEKWFNKFREPELGIGITKTFIRNDFYNNPTEYISFVIKTETDDYISGTHIGRLYNQSGKEIKLKRSPCGVWIPDSC